MGALHAGHRACSRGACARPTRRRQPRSSTRPSSARTRTSPPIPVMKPRMPPSSRQAARTCSYAPAVEEIYPEGFRHQSPYVDDGPSLRPVPARAFRRRGDRGDQAVAARPAGCRRCSVRRTGSNFRYPPPDPRPRHTGGNRRRADGTGGRRLGPVLTKRLSDALRARHRASTGNRASRDSADAVAKGEPCRAAEEHALRTHCSRRTA